MSKVDPSLFSQYGIKVNYTVSSSNSAGISAMATGSADMINGGYVLLGTAFKDPTFKAFARSGYLGQVLLVQPGIKNIADLKGKTIIMSSPGSPADLEMLQLLKQAGLSTSDVHLVYTGSGAAAEAAAEHNEGQAAIFGQPLALAVEKDTHMTQLMIIDDTSAKVYDSTLYAVNNSFAAAHPQAIIDFIKAMNAAVAYIPSHVSIAAQTLAQITGITVAEATQVTELYIKVGMNLGPITPADISANLAAIAGNYPGLTSKNVGSTFTNNYYDQATGVG